MINWKSILSTFNDKPTLLEWLKMVEKALKESVLTNVLTDTKDGKTSFIFTFEDGTEIRTDYVQTKGDPGSTSITGVEEVSSEVIGNQTATTLRINLSDGTFDDVVVYAKNGTDINLNTTTKEIGVEDISIALGVFTVENTSLVLTYNNDSSIINISGRVTVNTSATVGGQIGMTIDISPAKINRDYPPLKGTVGFVYANEYFESVTCQPLSNQSKITFVNRATFKNIPNGTSIFEINATLFLSR